MSQNGIKLSNGVPRTPATQGLTERSIMSWKRHEITYLALQTRTSINGASTQERLHIQETFHTIER